MTREARLEITMSEDDKRRLEGLARLAYLRGWIEKPSMAALMMLGFNLLWERARQEHLQVRNGGGG